MDNQEVKAMVDEAVSRSSLLGRPGFLIRRLHQVHCSLFQEETRGHDITPVQYSLLSSLGILGEMDQNTIAQAIGLERTSVAEVIPRLEARGLLLRRQSEKDKRVKLVKLARKGKTLVTKMNDAVQRAHDRTLEALPAEERDLFMLHLIRLVEANNEVRSAPLRLQPTETGN